MTTLQNHGVFGFIFTNFCFNFWFVYLSNSVSFCTFNLMMVLIITGRYLYPMTLTFFADLISMAGILLFILMRLRLKNDILKVLEIGRQFKITKKLQDLEPLDRTFNLRRHVIAKILATYYPDDFPQIYSDENILQIPDLFGKSRKSKPKKY